MNRVKILILATALSFGTTAAFAQANIGAGARANVGGGANINSGTAATGSANVKGNAGVNGAASRTTVGADVRASGKTKVRKHKTSGSIGTTGSANGSTQY